MPAKMLERGADEWNRWKKSAALGSVVVSGATLLNHDFRAYDLNHVTFDNCDFTNANFSGCRSSKTSFKTVLLRSASFKRAHFVKASFEGSDCREADFSGAILRGGKLFRSQFEKANLSGTELSQSACGQTVFDFATLEGANFSEAHLDEATFRNCIFHHVNLNGANFLGAHLVGASMIDCAVDSKTSFLGAKVAGFKIDDRDFFKKLSHFGGLTRNDLRQIALNDPVAKLQTLYSGFFQWAHVAGLSAFVFPYVWFLFQTWAEVHWNTGPALPESISLREAFARYVWNGGERWREGWFYNGATFLPFCLAFVYNGIRGILLWKTKKLEHHEAVTGLPASFRLEGFWLWLYQSAAFGLWINLVFVAIHTWHFLDLSVPVIR